MSSSSDHDMSESSSSPFMYSRESPHSSPSQQMPQLTTSLTELTCADNTYTYQQQSNKPFLRIVEQPQDHFRFRYVSEMVGTHGCLLGKSYGSNKTKTHPTVELVNYGGEAIIRCRLAQLDNKEEHPHKLLEEEQDRDVSYRVPERGSYKVGFAGMGIIHTAKKDVPGLLFKQLSENYKKSSTLVIKDLRAHCENMAKSINLNIVRLRFSAHDPVSGNEICDAVYSERIHNMKSAATNDLKICRISRSSGRPAGGEDIFIFVEKVNKKNIMIRLFELDENGERSWSSIGSFMQSDVHHQYAIVFRTPPYKDPRSPVDVQVYIELVRPSDGRTSEPKEFKYKAEQVYKKKRKMDSSYSSIESSSSGSIRGEIPLPVYNHVHPDDTMEEYRAPAIPQVGLSEPSYLCDLGSAMYPTPDASPLLAAAALTPPHSHSPAPPATAASSSIVDLKLNSADFEKLLQNDMDPDDIRQISNSQYFGDYMESYSDLMPDPTTVDILRSVMVSDSAKSRASSALVSDSGRAKVGLSEPSYLCDLGSAMYPTPDASPLLAAAALTPPHSHSPAPPATAASSSIVDLKLNSADFEKLLQNDMDPDDIRQISNSQYFGDYMESYSDLMPDPTTVDILRSVMVSDSAKSRASSALVSDSGRAKGKRTIDQPKRAATSDSAMKEEKPTELKTEPSSEKKAKEYPAFYKTEDGAEVKNLVTELCQIIRNKNGYKKQDVRNKLERLFELRLSNGDTFLHMTLCSNPPSVEYIVKIINSVRMTQLLDHANDKQQTVLHLAVANDMPRMVALLVAKGSNPMAKDHKEQNAVHYAVKYQACLEVLLDTIRKHDVPCDLNDCDNEKQSPLHVAAIVGCSRATRVLVQHGASYSARDSMGRTALHLAAYDGRLAVARALLEAMPPSEVDATDGFGNTALQIVCGRTGEDNTVEIAKLLLQKNADPLKHEEQTESAWHLLRRYKPELLAELLPELGQAGPMDDDVKSEPEDAFESADDSDGEAGLAELPQYARELAALLDASGGWLALAGRVRLAGLLGWYRSQPSPATTLLQHLKDSRDDITSKSLALILDDIGHPEAANIIRRYIY